MTILFVFITIIVIVIGYWVEVYNRDKTLRNLAIKREHEVSICFDRMWKIISQKAHVTSEYKTSFKEIYSEIISNRYQNTDKLMKWIQESNPLFEVTLYKDLMNSIEIERTSFQFIQSQLLDIIREHDNLLDTIPSKFFVSNKKRIEYKVITSEYTNNILNFKEENDLQLF